MRIPVLMIVCGIAGGGCRSATPQNATPVPRGPAIVYMLELAALPDSAVKLARWAMGAIDGDLQMARTHAGLTTISTHYVRSRRGGGETEVAVIAGIERSRLDSAAPVTRVELRAWALDTQEAARVSDRRGGFPQTPLSRNAPALTTPRAITAADTTDSANLGFVLQAFVRAGARRVP